MPREHVQKRPGARRPARDQVLRPSEVEGADRIDEIDASLAAARRPSSIFVTRVISGSANAAFSALLRRRRVVVAYPPGTVSLGLAGARNSCICSLLLFSHPRFSKAVGTGSSGRLSVFRQSSVVLMPADMW
jgi:hypothetical protein